MSSSVLSLFFPSLFYSLWNPKSLSLYPLHHHEFGSITPPQKLDCWHKIGILCVADEQARTGQVQERSCTVPPCRTDLCNILTWLEMPVIKFAVLPSQHNVKMFYVSVLLILYSQIIALDVISGYKPGLSNCAFLWLAAGVTGTRWWKKVVCLDCSGEFLFFLISMTLFFLHLFKT